MQVKTIRDNITELSILADELEIESNSFEELVFKKYIEYESLNGVVEHLKEANIRKASGAKYNPSDISSIISSRQNGVNPVVVKYAQCILDNNWKLAMCINGSVN